jgi:acyl-homoserine-lactone acylase
MKKTISAKAIRSGTGFVLAVLFIISCSCESNRISNTEILWDNYGVPHIYSKSDPEAYYAFGWAQMNSHANLILQLYAQSRGKASEYFREKYLDSDRKILLFDLPGLAENIYRQQDKKYRSALDAYVKGMNDYADSHREEIGEIYRQVLPVTALDVISHTIRVLSLEFLASEDIYCAGRMVSSGSNSLAVGPSKSQSGNAMLISNPHLPWSDFFTWFEAHINTPGLNVYGVTLVGMPVLTIAFNNNLGWTHTVNTIDASDRYELTLDGDGYILNGKREAFRKREVTIRVKQDDGTYREQKTIFKYSRHGPVLAERGNRAWAIRIAGLQNKDFFEQYYRMSAARNITEFESALRMLQNPMFNVVYADREGNILYVFNGDVPVRNEGDFAFWHGTLNGSDSGLIWHKYHQYDDLPRVLNPPSGFLQNCNDPPWICTFPPVLSRTDYPPYMAPTGMGWRPQRAVNMVKDNPSISFSELVDYKLNTGFEAADRFLDDLLSAVQKYPEPEALKAATVLKAWDRKADTGSRGAVLFAAWWNKLRGDMFLKPWSVEDPVTTPSGLKDPEGAVRLLVSAAEETRKKYGSIDIAWGDVNRFRIGSLDHPGNGGPDNCGIFRTIAFVPDNDGKNRAIAGDSWVAVTEFGDRVRSDVLLSYGNATQPGNKHSGDQLEMLSQKKLRHALLDRNDIERYLEKRESFDLEKTLAN